MKVIGVNVFETQCTFTNNRLVLETIKETFSVL